MSKCRFQEGDATNLHELENEDFDLVVSIFGAMFAPKPFDVAKEMVRVTRPGGRIVMGNWIPNDPTLVAQILKVCATYTPPPPEGFVSPMIWGVEDNVIERFTAVGVPKDNIAFARDTFTFNYPGPPSGFVGEFRAYYGPTMNLCSSGGERPSRRTPGGAGGAVRQPEHEPEPRRRPHFSDLPARDRHSGMRFCLGTQGARSRFGR